MRLPWILICVSIALAALLYLAGGASPPLMPLDDAYIHFQYARQITNGQPYHYNPADPATSGATSLLYPLVLALGYALGFTGLKLGMWALAIGLVSHALSAGLVYRLLVHGADSGLIPLVLALSYALSGAFLWAALSGMETSLFIAAVLLALYAYQQQNQNLMVAAGVAAGLLRPEGAIITLTVAALCWRSPRRWMPLLGVILLQPLINFVLTGSVSAAGSLAKSHLSNPTLPYIDRLSAIAENAWGIFAQLIVGRSPVDGWYLLPLLTLPALITMVMSLRASLHQRAVSVGLLAAGWVVLIGAAVATLDTAFWHFKRYQLPMMALFFPLGGWLLLRLEWLAGKRWLAGAILVFSLSTTFSFALRYHANLSVVENQQLAMATWVAQNLPSDARVVVHDVGMMRYMGERRTLDAVGLTAPPPAALAWREGSGTLYEHLASQKPDYFAMYPDVLSVPYLVQAGVFGEEQARFELELPTNTVASATGTQVVARAVWDGLAEAAAPCTFAPAAAPLRVLNVAHIAAETAQGYTWNQSPPGGFASEVRRLPYAAQPCEVIDGARVVAGGERFALPPASDSGYLVIVRVHAANSAVLHLCQSDQTRVVPNLPGHWVEIPFILPPDSREFCLSSSATYYPAHYWVYPAPPPPPPPVTQPLAQFGDPFVQNFTIDLLDFKIENAASQISVDLAFIKTAEMALDGKLFLHLYADPAAPPIMQLDAYPLGASPPANWLDGEIVRERFVLADVPSGTYTLALGFYDPLSGRRYRAEGAGVDAERVFLGEVSVR